MIPSDDYLNYLNNVDIRAITTTAGRCIVGEYHSSDEHGLFLINAFVFEPFAVEPLYPFSFNVPFLILDERIESEMAAGIALKKQYYDQYTDYRIKMFEDETLD
jgi:hypothetical protein|tara:strand:+ start:838 stop:1149 length:312 start_codon:yes stop_codon:yes gene_type:complete